METLHKNQRGTIRGNSDSCVTFERIVKPSYIGPILSLIAKSPAGELPFTWQNFRDWAKVSLDSHSIFLLLARIDSEEAGFLIATAPTEMEREAWIFQVYIAQPFRGKTQITKRWLDIAKAWARSNGVRKVAFMTDRPRAWRRLIGAKPNGQVRMEVSSE